MHIRVLYVCADMYSGSVCVLSFFAIVDEQLVLGVYATFMVGAGRLSLLQDAFGGNECCTKCT